MIAANINPGIYRRSFAFERWKDFDADLFDSIFNDDSAERDPMYPIVGADISPKAIDIARENIKSAGMAKYISLEVKPISRWNEAPQPAGILVTNPPYGERISAPDMDALYATIGNRLKNVFQGYHVWIIGYRDEYFAKIGLAASEKVPVLNGALECELREYVIFEGDKKSFLKAGGKLKNHVNDADDERATRKGGKDRKFRDGAQKDRKFRDGDSKERRFKDKDHKHRDDFDRSNKFKDRPMREDIQPDSENPLAVRRNPYALRSLQGKSPSLPPQKGPIMRSRGWKKK